MFQKFLKRMDIVFSQKILIKIIGFLLIVYLLKATSSVWTEWFSLLVSIFQPFILAFILAFIIHPIVQYLDKKGISKNVSIIAIWILIIVLVVVLCLVLLPLLYEKLAGFIGNLTIGVEWISEKIVAFGEFENFSLVNKITETITDFLNSYNEWLPMIISSIPAFMTSLLGVVTNTLFTIIITIYMLFDFDHIKGCVKKFFALFYSKSGRYLTKIDEDVSVYLRSMFILMVIKFCEYCLFYFLIGHEDWIIIGFLAAIGLLIPYLGGTIANVIGIITALTLSPLRIFLLIAGICILSNVDAYVISPMIHEKRSSLGPLVTLLAVFAGGVLYGGLGIMVSVPVAIACKAICDVANTEMEQMETESS